MAQANHDIVAIACVVESSLMVHQNWTNILTEYFTPILRRLQEMYTSGSKIRLAFVTYATAGMKPSPLLARQFFAEWAVVVKVIKDDTRSLGLGQTNSGGGRGMAALEGMVAALELFDELYACQDYGGGKVIASHLLHVASTNPDNAEHPLWNHSPTFDKATWASLPAEFRKRNINLNMIHIRGGGNHFAELQSASCTVQQPWFQVRPTHTVTLSGLVNNKPAVKRGAEASVSPADSKRVKPNPSSEASPKSMARPASRQSQLPTPPRQHPPQQLPPVTKPIAFPGLPPNITPADIANHRQKLFSTMRQLQATIQAAEATGDKEAAEKARKEQQATKVAYDIVERAIHAMVAKQRQVQAERIAAAATATAGVTGQGIGAEQGQHGQGNTNQLPSHVSPPQASRELVPPQFGPGPNTNTINNSVNATNNFALALQTSRSNSVAVQMQKMMEENQRNPGNNNMGMNQQQQTSRSGSSQGPDPTLVQGPPKPVWHGTLLWTARDNTGAEKEIPILAGAACQTACHQDTWPTTFCISQAKEPPVNVNELQAWVKHHSGIIINFSPSPRAPDKNMNHRTFMALSQYLASNNLYATAAWTLPSGAQERGLLLVPMAGTSFLIGVIFPYTGLPELPRRGVPFGAPSSQHEQQLKRMQAQQQAAAQQQTYAMANNSNNGLMMPGSQGVTAEVLQSFLSSRAPDSH